MTTRYLSDEEMAQMMLRALSDRVSSKGVEDIYRKNKDGSITISPNDFYKRRQVGVNFDAGKERQQETEDFYRSVALPNAALIAKEIGDKDVVFARLETEKHLRGDCAENEKCFVRIHVMNSLDGPELGRFDVCWRETP